MIFHCAGIVPPSDNLRSQVGIGILLHMHDGMGDSVTNRNECKSVFCHCEGMDPPSDHLRSQAGIGIFLHTHDGM